MVTNPATRDWTVTASLFATLNEMYGNRTVCGIGRGDSAVRVTQRQADHAGDAARVDPRDPRAGQRPRGRVQGRRRCSFPWGDGVAARRSGSRRTGRWRSTLTGEVGDGFILQLADPDIAAWTIERRARRRERRPAATPTSITFCVAAPAYVGDDLGRTCATSAAGSAAWSATTSPTSSRRYGDDGAPCRRRSPTTSRAAQGYDYNEHGRAGQHARRLRARRDRRPVLHPRPGRAAHRAARGAARRSASTSSPSTCSTTTRTQTLQAYGETSSPRSRARDGQGVTLSPRRVAGRAHRRRPSRAVRRSGDARRSACSRCCSARGCGSSTRPSAPSTAARARDAASCRAPTTVAMPHVVDDRRAVLASRSVRDGRPHRGVGACSPALLFTLGVAAVGWVHRRRSSGSLLAVADAALPLAERGLLPYVVLQPDGAADRARAAGRRAGAASSVFGAAVAAVDVGRGDRGVPRVLPGRRSARCAGCSRRAATQVELMRALRRRLVADAGAAAAAGRACRTCCPALRLAAAAAVVGAIVAEISTGTKGGIGRLIIDYAQAGHRRPAEACTPPSLGAAVLGLVAAGARRACSTWRCAATDRGGDR